MPVNFSLPDVNYSEPDNEDVEVKPDPLEDLKAVVNKTIVSKDVDRMNAATNLVNTFNYAVQVQANRVKWQPSDYKAFAIALVALDSIGKTATEVDETLDPYRTHEPVNKT